MSKDLKVKDEDGKAASEDPIKFGPSMLVGGAIGAVLAAIFLKAVAPRLAVKK